MFIDFITPSNRYSPSADSKFHPSFKTKSDGMHVAPSTEVAEEGGHHPMYGSKYFFGVYPTEFFT